MKTWIKVLLIVGGVLLTLGIVAGAVSVGVMGFHISPALHDFEITEITHTEDILPNAKIAIDIDVEDINVTVSKDGKLHLDYGDSAAITHSYSYSSSELTLTSHSKRFTFLSRAVPIELQIPADFAGELILTSATGHIELEGVGADKITLSLTTGHVDLKDVSAKELSATATTGGITIKNCTMGKTALETSTGGMNLKNLSSTELKAKCTTGSVSLTKLIASKVQLETTTGSLRGSIVGKARDWSVTSSTTTGSNSLKGYGSNGGANILNARSTTGSIDIDFTDK